MRFKDTQESSSDAYERLCEAADLERKRVREEAGEKCPECGSEKSEHLRWESFAGQSIEVLRCDGCGWIYHGEEAT